MFFFQAEDGIRDIGVTGVQTCALPICVWLGMATAVASAITFNYFHIPPAGGLEIHAGEDWVALAVFFVAAVVTSSLAQRARRRAEEAEDRRRAGDLALELARLLLQVGRAACRERV